MGVIIPDMHICVFTMIKRLMKNSTELLECGIPFKNVKHENLWVVFSFPVFSQFHE